MYESSLVKSIGELLNQDANKQRLAHSPPPPNTHSTLQSFTCVIESMGKPSAVVKSVGTSSGRDSKKAPAEQPKQKTSKTLHNGQVIYVAEYKDIDYHNDRNGGLVDQGILGLFTSIDEANAAVEEHFAAWDADFFESRVVTHDADGLRTVVCECPEGEVMEAWATKKLLGAKAK